MVLTFKTDPARTAALASNRTRYDGASCNRCKGTERYTSSGGCVQCASARSKQRVDAGLIPRYRAPASSARGAATASGAAFYTGAPCLTCEGTERYASSGGCVHCAKSKITTRAGPVREKPVVPAPPDDSRCQCCGEIAILTIDHDHVLEALGFPGSETFRGWLCYSCNSGIGRLGDTLEGAKRAVAYLTRATERQL